MKVAAVTTQAEVKRLDALTSFRFFAAMLVFLFHAGIWSNYQTGYLGVNFFFILSGFILTYNYRSKFHRLERNQIKTFYIARIAKIYPVHLLTFLIAIPYYFFIPLQHQKILYVFQAATNVGLIHSFIPFGNVSFNGVSWSLSDEMFFYLLFPFILFFLLKHHFNAISMLLTGAGVWFLLSLCFVFLPSHHPYVVWLIYYFPGVRIFEFIAGSILGILFMDFKLSRKLSFVLSSLLEIITICFLIGMLMVSPHFPQNLRYGMAFTPVWCMLIFVFAFQNGLISRMLSNKTLVFLGNISFSFYMVHNLILSYVYFLWKPPIPQPVTITLCLLGAIILSAAMYLFFEEPMRKKVKAFLAALFEKGYNHQKQLSIARQ